MSVAALGPRLRISPPKTDTVRAGARARDGALGVNTDTWTLTPGETMLTLEHYTDIAHCNG